MRYVFNGILITYILKKKFLKHLCKLILDIKTFEGEYQVTSCSVTIPCDVAQTNHGNETNE